MTTAPPGFALTESNIWWSNNLNARLNRKTAGQLTLLLHGFPDAIAFLTARIPFFAAPKRVHDRIFVFGKTLSAEHLAWIVVSVMAAAVSAIFSFNGISFHSDSSTVSFPCSLLATRLKSPLSLSITEATIMGKTIVASPITMTLSA